MFRNKIERKIFLAPEMWVWEENFFFKYFLFCVETSGLILKILSFMVKYSNVNFPDFSTPKCQFLCEPLRFFPQSCY